jgi:monofunctional biosynthetic peptidoglycan transglycosylase
MTAMARQIRRMLGLLLLCLLALQLYFAGRIALMALLAPQSTSFQRSEAWRLIVDKHALAWSQTWVEDRQLSPHLKRAVIASEDAGFAEHSGVEWDAIENAWQRNQKAQARAERQAAGKSSRPGTAASNTSKPVPKIIGGSTISQQLAKNLFLSGERNAPRKAQELVITLMLEAMLGKRRILTLYLNNVEWGEGVFGAQAAARHYFRLDASQLGPAQAAQLAVMLPAPKRFERNPGSGYVMNRAATIVARMPAVELP